MRIRTKTWLAGVGLASLLLAAPARAEVNVVASFKPVHSIVAGVMRGVGKPHLLVEAGSPHTYSLKPSDATALQRADMVVWVGPDFETFLTEPLKTLSGKARRVTLSKAHGLTLLPFRAGGQWEKHKHGADDHDDEHGHAGEKHDDHGHEKKHGHADEKHDDHAHEKKHGHAEEKHDDHAHEKEHAGHKEHDLHLWLDPNNAKAFTEQVVMALVALDPANAATYKKNAAGMLARLDKLTAELKNKLAAHKSKPYIVFHDAYQYLEKRFGLNAVGSVTVSPEQQPGARRLQHLKKLIRERKVACVFAEPQFKPKLVNVIIEGTDAKTGQLDPVGAQLKPGPELYFDLLRGNAESFASCMKK